MRLDPELKRAAGTRAEADHATLSEVIRQTPCRFLEVVDGLEQDLGWLHPSRTRHYWTTQQRAWARRAASLVRKASRGLQTTRVLLLVVFLGVAAFAATRRAWFLVLIQFVGAAGAAAALRKGEAPPSGTFRRYMSGPLMGMAVLVVIFAAMLLLALL